MLQKLKTLIDTCGDTEFSVGSQNYTIITWMDDGLLIGPQGSDQDQTFQTADDLIQGYQIGGKPLADLADQITILFAG